MGFHRVKLFLELTAVAVFAWLCSCSTGDTGNTGCPGTQAAPVYLSASKRVIDVLTPRSVLEESSFPPGACEQSFTVTGGENLMTWRVTFPAQDESWAGFSFRRTNDLAAIHDHGRVELRVKPDAASSHLGIVLVDGHGAVAYAPLAGPRIITAGDGWGWSVISLVDFRDQHISNNVSATVSSAKFDWSGVREFRLMSDGHLPQPVVQITRLRIVE